MATSKAEVSDFVGAAAEAANTLCFATVSATRIGRPSGTTGTTATGGSRMDVGTAALDVGNGPLQQRFQHEDLRHDFQQSISARERMGKGL
jgi:hypothetical protein